MERIRKPRHLGGRGLEVISRQLNDQLLIFTLFLAAETNFLKYHAICPRDLVTDVQLRECIKQKCYKIAPCMGVISVTSTKIMSIILDHSTGGRQERCF